jgi:membrane carboxypeptidase/penicillin-binding protein
MISRPCFRITRRVSLNIRPTIRFISTGYDVAVKTGTTNDFRDAWTIGYTPSIVLGAWAGNNDNSPMVKEIAGYIVAPMWHVIMQKALENIRTEYFGEPRTTPGDAKARISLAITHQMGKHMNCCIP